MFHKRLATSNAAYGFLHQNNLLKHWERYAKSARISKEIDQLSRDIKDLLEGYHEFVKAQDRFLLDDLRLPDSLESDFRVSRNLFSLGLDEVGLLIAGRGLEGVLREIVRLRRIEIVDGKGRASPAFEADFYDIIEAMFQLRWKRNGARLITPDTKALLHYLRTLRNAGAHANIRQARFVASPRETAALTAETANELWKQAATRAQLTPTSVQRTW